MSKEILVNMVNELAVKIHKGDNKAWTDLYECLAELKARIVKHYEQKYSCYNVSESDLEEAFDLALFQSVKHYKFDDEKAEAPFYYYFQSAANIECRAVLRRAKAQSRKVYCDYVSFSAPSATNKDGDSVTIGDAIPDSFQLEDTVISKIEVSPKIQTALNKLRQKDADIIKIHLTYADKKERKAVLQRYFIGVKDATIRKNVQRAKERFAKALGEEAVVAC